MKTLKQIRQEQNTETRKAAEQFFKDYEGKHFRQFEHGTHVIYKFEELKFHSYKGVILVSAFVSSSDIKKYVGGKMNTETKLIPINIDNCQLLERGV